MKFTINSTKLIKTAKSASGHTGLTAKTRLTTKTKLTIKTAKASLCILAFSVVALAVVFVTQTILNTSTASAKRALSDSETRIFAQNNLIGWDPGECSESSSSSGICGDTPKEKYWSYLRQTFDEVHTAAIIGNIDNEGGYGPTRWEIGLVVDADGGNFIGKYTDWNNLYNCQPCNVGVGSVGITWNLGNYLQYVEKNVPEAFPYFKDSSYSLPGDQAIEKIGSATFDKLVEAEMGWMIKEATDNGIIDDFNAITDVRGAAKYWAENYERCEGCLASQGMTTTKQSRMDDAEYEYEALKNFVCTNSSSNAYASTSFSLSDGELYGMLHMAKNEQDSVEGIKFELSFIANKADQAGRSDIVNYAKTSSLFTSSALASYKKSRGSLSDAEVQAGREVLTNGNRSIPSQITEHICIGDIDWLELNGIKYNAANAGNCSGTGLENKSYFISGATKIHTVSGSTFVFYSFPKSGDITSGDAFGYLESNPPSSASSSSSSSASSTSSNSESSATASTTVSGSNVTWIGDSYSTGAQSIIEEKLPGISFGGTANTASSTIQGCKFVSIDTSCNANPTNPSGLKVLKEVIEAGTLEEYLVFALGTNGEWTDNDVSEFSSLLKDKDVKVVLVTSKTPNNDYSASNARLEQLVNDNDNYYLADWTTVYNEKYFDGDPEKIHPVSNGGYEAWVKLIVDTLNGVGNDCTSYKDKYPQYYQGDYENSDHANSTHDWTSDSYAGENVAGAGCGPTSMAMLATVATGKDIYPYDIIEATIAWGDYVYNAGLKLDLYVGEKYGFEVIEVGFKKTGNDAYNKVKEYLQNGYMIHAFGSNCHDGFATVRSNGSCTTGHAIGIFSIDSNDRVQVANSGYMGNNETALQNIIDAMLDHNAEAFMAIKGSGNKTTCDNNYCSNNNSTAVSSKGITEQQAQKIAHYYNTQYTPTGCCDLTNCVEFSGFFVSELTTKNGSAASFPNGNLVADHLISGGQATGGSEPKAWAVFSKIDGQHTGVVVGVNSDGTYITIEAAWPGWGDKYMDGNGNGRVFANKTFDDGVYKFAYFANALNTTKINEILNN